MINSASVSSSVAQGKERLVLELISPFLRLGRNFIKTMKLLTKGITKRIEEGKKKRHMGIKKNHKLGETTHRRAKAH